MDGQSINHTSYQGLCKRSIAISFKVKRTSNGADKAKLQLIVLLTAYWSKLQHMYDSQLELPEFLLAVWIQGTDWSLVVSTRRDQHTVSDPPTAHPLVIRGNVHSMRVCFRTNLSCQIVWTKLDFGDTRSAIGVYRNRTTM